MQWQWIIGPAVGSVIGYITNDIAVRMLLRPHKELRLFGRRVPFTPGLIPKERPRLARAIRDVLDQELLSPQVLEEALLSGRMMGTIEDAAERALEAILREERTSRQLLEGAFGEAGFGGFEANARRAAGIFLMEKLLQSGVEEAIAHIAVAEARERVSTSTGGIAKLFWDEKRSASMEDSLQKTIRELLATHAPALVDGMIDSALRDALDVPIGEALSRYEGRLDEIRAFLIEQYQRAIRAGLPGALRVLDLGSIVEDKLNSLSMEDIEGLIMQVMRRELRAIVWLGALLGAIMGLVNAVIPAILP